MLGRPLCILREPNGLHVLRLPERDVDGLRRVPLDSELGAMLPNGRVLAKSWNALSVARGTSADTLANVLCVLLTTESGDASSDVKPPRLEPVPESPRRSAAHPRGYRGTIQQPPKKRTPEAIDLRPHLASRVATAALLRAMRPHVEAALVLLEAWRFDHVRLERVSRALCNSRPGDPSLAYHHGMMRAGAALPPSFSRLGRALGAASEEAFRKLVALRGRLAIDTDPVLLSMSARLLLEWNTPRAISWLEVASRLGVDAQRELLGALIEANVRGLDPAKYEARFEPLARVKSEWKGPNRRVQYLRGLDSGVPSEQLLGGFRLLDAFGLDEVLPTTCPGDVPEDLLLEIFVRIEPESGGHYYLTTLWSLCGELPGFTALLREVPWETLTPRAAFAMVELLTTFHDQAIDRKESSRRWRAGHAAIRKLLPRLAALKTGQRPAAVEILSSQLAYGTPPWPSPSDVATASLDFIDRVCRLPLGEPDRICWALEALALHPEESVRSRFLGSPDRSFQQMAEACSREDFAGLIGDGIARLVAHDVELVVDGFVHAPELLARTARMLATLRRRDCGDVLGEHSRHPFMTDLPRLGLEAVAVLFARHCTEGVESPLPRAIRTALERGNTLSAARRARAEKLIVERLPRLRLQLLGRLVLEALRGHLPASLGEERVRHALQMASLIDDNRRPLRRLLARHFAGDHDFIRNHPASQAWFSRHTRLDASLWWNGIVGEGRTHAAGPVTLKLEQDPLEALRLGTHVGSCLGLNGLCGYSAAAAVLDVNKRVLYARDVHGAVVARQLLAISVDDRLVAFSVYPASASPELKMLFLDYDLRFSEQLGLALAEGADDPDVDTILSTAFWHDGPWELFW